MIRPPLFRAWIGPGVITVLVLLFNPPWSSVFIICGAYAIGYHNGRAGTAESLLDNANDSD